MNKSNDSLSHLGQRAKTPLFANGAIAAIAMAGLWSLSLPADAQHKGVPIILNRTPPTAAPQLHIPQVDSMPNEPAAALSLDWRQRALDFGALVMNPSNGISYLDAAGNLVLPSYYEESHTDQEAISIMPAILGRYLLGEDESDYFATVAEYWQQPTTDGGNGAQVYLNNISTNGGSFWYDMMPCYYAVALTSIYGDSGEDMLHKWYTSANAWSDCGYYLNHNFVPYYGYDFVNHVGLTSNFTEPDIPGGMPGSSIWPTPASATRASWLRPKPTWAC